MLCFVSKLRELERLGGEWPFEGNQPFGQTPTSCPDLGEELKPLCSGESS